MLFEFFRSTLYTTSQVLTKTPFSLKIPKASMMLCVSLNGTISGILSLAPFSKMQSKSTCVTSPVWLWIRMLSPCRSPSPITYPIIDQMAVDRTKFTLASYQSSGEVKCSAIQLPRTGLISSLTTCQICVWVSPDLRPWALLLMSCISPLMLFFFQKSPTTVFSVLVFWIHSISPEFLLSGTIAYVRNRRFRFLLSESFSSILLHSTAKSMKRCSFRRSPYLSHFSRKLYSCPSLPLIPIFFGFSFESMMDASGTNPWIRTGLGLKAGNSASSLPSSCIWLRSGK
mmetsp:Transcript_25760/g.25043  ORF Transcript_25760/g.25043 Transcript_25760/m.25043 type:complete len:285 (-) Transcript_25760:2273-3127(-)